MASGIPIYLSRSTRAGHLTAVLSLIALSIGLVLYGWYFHDRETTLWFAALGIFISGMTLRFVRNAKILRFDSAPVFTIRPNGVEISPDNMLPWTVLKDAVVFRYEGDKIIGLRLREEFDQWKRSEIEEKVANSMAWETFGMPLIISFSGLSISGEDLITHLSNHGLKITIIEKEVFIGEESTLR